ncbi:MAG TPA: ABC transporter permease [Tepidisphaeraceae bacterium]|nr:ABC transporter permease [Tepidisphaeraceae bacterium]
MVLWKYRRFILANAFSDLRHRFSGSVGGYLWNVFIPLAQLLIFALIFSVLQGAHMTQGPQNRFSFILFLCSGLLAWNAFAETLVRACAALVGNAGYLKKLPLPEQIFVAQEATSGFFTAAISIALFILFSILIAGYGPFWTWLQALPLLLLFICFAYGLGLMLSCFNVFFRDVQPFMNVVVLLWFWLTPVVYFEDTFAKSPLVLKLLHANPAYYFIDAFHQSLWLGQWVSRIDWLVCIGLTLVANLLAVTVVRRFRAELRDVL